MFEKSEEEENIFPRIGIATKSFKFFFLNRGRLLFLTYRYNNNMPENIL